MSTNESPEISDSANPPEPLKPHEIKEKLYSALEEHGYVRSDVSIAPGYLECVTQDGVEISGFINYPSPELRVDVSVLVDVPRKLAELTGFQPISYGGKKLLAPKEGQFRVTEGNLEEVLEKLVYLGEIGMEIARANPGKRVH